MYHFLVSSNLLHGPSHFRFRSFGTRFAVCSTSACSSPSNSLSDSGSSLSPGSSALSGTWACSDPSRACRGRFGTGFRVRGCRATIWVVYRKTYVSMALPCRKRVGRMSTYVGSIRVHSRGGVFAAALPVHGRKRTSWKRSAWDKSILGERAEPNLCLCGARRALALH